MNDISICIVDDHKELGEALEEIISISDGFVCVGKFSTAQDATTHLPAIEPNVVLMDINLGVGESGIDCISILKPKMPKTNFMICTVYDEDDKIFDALRAGATGYILKKTPPEKMLEAIRELHEGGAPMSNQIAKKVVSMFHQNQYAKEEQDKFGLSRREVEILELVSKGYIYKEIGAQLNISPQTVKKHVYHIYEKLHVSNQIEAINVFFGGVVGAAK